MIFIQTFSEEKLLFLNLILSKMYSSLLLTSILHKCIKVPVLFCQNDEKYNYRTKINLEAYKDLKKISKLKDNYISFSSMLF